MLAWCIAIVQSLLIISSRKHYSVDVVVAWLVDIYWTGWLCHVSFSLCWCIFLMQVYCEFGGFLCG